MGICFNKPLCYSAFNGVIIIQFRCLSAENEWEIDSTWCEISCAKIWIHGEENIFSYDDQEVSGGTRGHSGGRARPPAFTFVSRLWLNVICDGEKIKPASKWTLHADRRWWEISKWFVKLSPVVFKIIRVQRWASLGLEKLGFKHDFGYLDLM